MAMKQLYDEKFLKEALPLYYEKLFPVNLIYKWLRYNNNLNMEKREITFELPGTRFLRRRSFENENELQKYLLKKVPLKIDIGAVYNVSPRDFIFTSTFEAIEKELVFDIDMSDYNDVRTCCDEANICNKCWKFICVACKVLLAVLKRGFGFKHILCVYSGRRGIHCWVCDEKARKLSDHERDCILSYINIVRGGTHISRRVQLSGQQIHFQIMKSLDIISKYFETCIIVEQNVLGTEDGIKKFLKIIWDAPTSFEDVIRKGETSMERWQAFQLHYDTLKQSNFLPSKLKFLKEEVMLHFMYPRFDCNVTRKMEHLLKAPFCVHPKTGRISVPFVPSRVDSFNLDEVPTLDLVLNELDQKFAQLKRENDTFCIESNNVDVNVTFTSLSKAFSCFKQFLEVLDKASAREESYRW